MNAYSRPPGITLPALPAHWVKTWMEKTQDLVLLLDASAQITGIFQSEFFETADTYHWIGQSLSAVVCRDSHPKLPLLLNNDAAQDEDDARWRHINLLRLSGESLPVLARCMSLPGDASAKAIFCRDLRPLKAANDRFQVAQQELEQRNQSLRDRLQQKDSELSAMSALRTEHLVRTIKEANYAQVIRETIQQLERQCLQALLDEAGGDDAKAAAMAGLSLSEWLQKRAWVRLI